jgi:hypothetical protein
VKLMTLLVPGEGKDVSRAVATTTKIMASTLRQKAIINLDQEDLMLTKLAQSNKTALISVVSSNGTGDHYVDI